jgi:hypothetical protein
MDCQVGARLDHDIIDFVWSHHHSNQLSVLLAHGVVSSYRLTPQVRTDGKFSSTFEPAGAYNAVIVRSRKWHP